MIIFLVGVTQPRRTWFSGFSVFHSVICERNKFSIPSSYVPGKVVARTTIRPPLIQDEGWPLTQDDPRALVVDIRRRTEEDLMQIEASRVVASAIRFNTPLRTITDTVRRRTHQWRHLRS